MSDLERDLQELDWWRSSFATRFMTGDLPRPGDALLGRRWRLVDDDTGERVTRDRLLRGEI